jgi:ABC-type glycerol-3-phosphate transport system substrate-binding protein
MKRILLITTAVAFLAIAFLCFSACGRRDNDQANDAPNLIGTTEPTHPTGTGAEPANTTDPDPEPEVITLSMIAPDYFAPVLREAERLLNRFRGYYHRQGIIFKLDLTTYDVTNRANHLERFNTMFMAGSGYDLFIVDGHPIWNYSRSNMLADIYTLIDRCTIVNRDDFYSNVLEAFEYRGQLLSIPLSFGFPYVGVNSTLPQAFINRFLEYDTISLEALLDLYFDLITAYPDEFGHMNVDPGIDYTLVGDFSALAFTIFEFMDADARTVSLMDERFMNFLQKYQFAASNILRNRNNFRGLVPIHPRHMTDERVYGFAFNSVDAALLSWEALFELEAPPFLGYIPITDSLGRLIIDNYSTLPGGNKAIAVSNGANQDAAWVFIRYIINVVADSNLGWDVGFISSHVGPNSLKTSIMTERFEERAQRAFRSVFEHAERDSWELIPYVGQGTRNARPQQIDNAILRLERYNAMPVVQRPNLPNNNPLVWDFINGAITSQSLAQQLQNRLSLWLIE